MARVFSYNGMELADPDPGMSTDQVRELYAITHGELNTATVTGPKKRGDDQVYTFSRALGRKG